MTDCDQYAFGSFVLDPSSKTLFRNGKAVRLTPKDVQVLLKLVEHHGRVVTAQTIMTEVWPGSIVRANNLARHVATVRQALGDSSQSPTYIQTLSKVGYMFVADVARTSGAAGSPGPSAEPGPSAAPIEVAGEGAEALPPGRRSLEAREMARGPAPEAGGRDPRRWALPSMPRLRALGLAAAIVAAGTAAVAWASARAAAAARGPIRSVAVLPVDNFTGDPGQDAFARSLEDLLVSELVQVRGLKVAPRGEAPRIEPEVHTTREVAHHLQVAGLLDVDLVGSDGENKVTATLLDARSDRARWSRSFELTHAAKPDLARRIAAALAEELGLQPPAPELSQSR